MMDKSVRPTNILGVPFSTMTMEETVLFCEELIGAAKGRASKSVDQAAKVASQLNHAGTTGDQVGQEIGPSRALGQTSPPCRHQVVTANPEIVMAARADSALMEILHDASLVTCDGTGIVWASRYTARPAPERVAGYDLSLALLALAQGQGLSLYLLGSAPTVIDAAVDKIRERWPGLEIAGHHHGYFCQDKNEKTSETDQSSAKERINKSDKLSESQLVNNERNLESDKLDINNKQEQKQDKSEREIIAEIKSLQPDILLVGLGAPKQEFWISENLQELGVPLVMGVGGSLDVLAGAVKRAPVFWQKIHLEWLYRLVMQPSRWRRALAIPRFMALVFWQMILPGKSGKMK